MAATSYRIGSAPVTVLSVSTAERRIATPIPAPGTTELLDRLARVESRSMQGPLPIVWEHAEGHSVFDIAGNKWIDFTSTIFVTNIGHSNPALIKAVEDCARSGLLHSYAYASRARVDYLEKLIAFAGPPFEKAFLLSAGTEATEAALKLMRLNGLRAGKRRLGIICIEGNWHGRTMGAQLMSSNVEQRRWIGDVEADIHHLPFPYPWVLEGRSATEFLDDVLNALAARGIDLEQDICGTLLETCQGWGAVFYPVDFVQALAARCRASSILVAFDEMQTGFARTGEKFGYRHYGVEPDLIACGKGMGSGLPLSGVLGRAEIMDLPEAGSMSSTHSANPLVCTAGSVTLDELERLDLVAETSRKEKILLDGLETLRKSFPDRISHILGHGLLLAVITRNAKTGEADGAFASRVAERCMQKGLLVVHTGRESIKIGPPLVITDDALREGLAVLTESVAEIVQEG